MGDEEFGIIANSKTEDAIIFEIGESIVEGSEEDETKKIKKTIWEINYIYWFKKFNEFNNMIIAALIGSIEDGNIHCELENETEY